MTKNEGGRVFANPENTCLLSLLGGGGIVLPPGPLPPFSKLMKVDVPNPDTMVCGVLPAVTCRTTFPNQSEFPCYDKVNECQCHVPNQPTYSSRADALQIRVAMTIIISRSISASIHSQIPFLPATRVKLLSHFGQDNSVRSEVDCHSLSPPLSSWFQSQSQSQSQSQGQSQNQCQSQMPMPMPNANAKCQCQCQSTTDSE